MKFKDKHLEAIEMRIHGKKNKEICEKLNICNATLKLWVMDKEFKAEEERQREEMKECVQKKLASAADLATQTLIDGLTGTDKTAVNIRSAEILLKYAMPAPDQNINVKAQIEQVNLTLDDKKKLLLEELTKQNLEQKKEED